MKKFIKNVIGKLTKKNRVKDRCNKYKEFHMQMILKLTTSLTVSKSYIDDLVEQELLVGPSEVIRNKLGIMAVQKALYRVVFSNADLYIKRFIFHIASQKLIMGEYKDTLFSFNTTDKALYEYYSDDENWVVFIEQLDYILKNDLTFKLLFTHLILNSIIRIFSIYSDEVKYTENVQDGVEEMFTDLITGIKQ